MRDSFDNLAWMERMACEGRSLADFMPSRGRQLAPEVFATCRSCPVRRDCVEFAYQQGTHELWRGGLSPAQQKSLTLEKALEAIARD